MVQCSLMEKFVIAGITSIFLYALFFMVLLNPPPIPENFQKNPNFNECCVVIDCPAGEFGVCLDCESCF